MSINGSISVNVLFHDTDGTTSLKISSLRSNTDYGTGKVAVLTGTASTAAFSFSALGATTYRDASGSLVSFSAISRVAFAWSGPTERVLSEVDDNQYLLRSANNRVAVSDVPNFTSRPQISDGTGTGTYTIILYGT